MSKINPMIPANQRTSLSSSSSKAIPSTNEIPVIGTGQGDLLNHNEEKGMKSHKNIQHTVKPPISNVTTTMSKLEELLPSSANITHEIHSRNNIIYNPHNDLQVRKVSNEKNKGNANEILTSITEQVKQSIQTLEERIESSQTNTESLLRESNELIHSSLEKNVIDLKNQQEEDSQTLHETSYKIDNILERIMEHFKIEGDKLNKQQSDLFQLQVR